MRSKTGKAKEEKTRYELRALGYCVEASAHRLSPKSAKIIEGYRIKGSPNLAVDIGTLEEILPGYDCYGANLWSTGIAPVLDAVRLVLVDPRGELVFEVKKAGAGLCPLRESSPAAQYIAKKNSRTLVYSEESKGDTATWIVESSSVPKPSDFTVVTGRIVVGQEETEYIESVMFRGVELERDYDAEFVRGKSSFTRLL